MRNTPVLQVEDLQTHFFTAAGVVRASFVGPPTATDLWASLATAREGGAPPP